MNKTLFSAIILAAVSGSAATPPARTVPDSFVKTAIHFCAGEPTLTRRPMDTTLPDGFSGEYIVAESPTEAGCKSQYAAIVAADGSYWVGGPWLLSGAAGESTAEKIKNFGWTRIHESFEATISPTVTRHGLLETTVKEKSESGAVLVHGWVDPAGRAFFPGDFHSPTENLKKERLDSLQSVISAAPSRGPASAAVTLVEFSDFECPSCKAATKFVPPLLAKYGDKIRYVRVDMPLMSMHPWAFAAALAGRAIYHQSPDAFWKFKDQVYDSQSELSMFTLEDFARNFVKDHGLDLAKYDADIASPKLKDELFDGEGKAFSLGIMGTPTYMVDGILVDGGSDGSGLAMYLAKVFAAPVK